MKQHSPVLLSASNSLLVPYGVNVADDRSLNHIVK